MFMSKMVERYGPDRQWHWVMKLTLIFILIFITTWMFMNLWGHVVQQLPLMEDRIFSSMPSPGMTFTPLTADAKDPREEGSHSETASLHCVLVSQTSVKEFLGSKVEECQGDLLRPTMQLGNWLEVLCAQDSGQPSITDNIRKGYSFPCNHVFQDGNVCISVQTLTISLENS